MFRVNIFKSINGEFIGRELFKDSTHASNWIIDEAVKTGFYYEIVDLENDSGWVEEDIKQKRKKEYPSVEEIAEAVMEHLMENKSQKLQELQTQREAIKLKYPKANG